MSQATFRSKDEANKWAAEQKKKGTLIRSVSTTGSGYVKIEYQEKPSAQSRESQRREQEANYGNPANRNAIEAQNRSNESMGNPANKKREAENRSNESMGNPANKKKTTTVRTTGGTPMNYYKRSEDVSAPKSSAKTTPKAGVRQTSLGNPYGLQQLEKMSRAKESVNRSLSNMGNPANSKAKSTSVRDAIPKSQYAAKDTTTGWRKSEDALSKAFKSASGTTTQKKKFDANEAMRERREAAKAQGKGTWNAEEEMRKRREAARAQGKGTWNAEEEMRKRREAAMAKKRGGK